MSEAIFVTDARAEKAFIVTGPPDPLPERLRTSVVWLPVRFATDPANGQTYPLLVDRTFVDDTGTTWQEKSRVPSELSGEWCLVGVVATRAECERIQTLLRDTIPGVDSSYLGEGYWLDENESVPKHYGVWINALAHNLPQERNTLWREFRAKFEREFPKQDFGSYIAVS